MENPKHIRAIKDGKSRLELLPRGPLADVARVMAHGADKYGERNWRIDQIMASTYEGSMMRHLFAWADGETFDPESGEHHLAHIAANCLIVMDAEQFHGCFLDNRDRAVSIDQNSNSQKSAPSNLSNDNDEALARYWASYEKTEERGQ
jgi:hypothetical protein